MKRYPREYTDLKMPQSEIVEALTKRRGQRMTVAEIAAKLGYPKNTVARSVGKLVKSRMVKTELVKRPQSFKRKDNGRQYSYMKHVRRVWL